MTSTVDHDTPLVTAIRSLTPEISARVDEIEAARRVPDDLIDKLKAAGAFRMLLQREYGGLEVDVVQYMDVVEELARVDGSVAWTVMIGASFPMFWIRYPDAVREAIFAEGPDVLARGALSPKGVATPVDGGYTVNGRWQLASGSYDATWAFVTCVVMENGTPRLLSHGLPDMRVVVLPIKDVEFVETWDALGLRATASDDIVITDKFVPDSHAVCATEGDVIFGQAEAGPMLRRTSIYHLAGWHSALMTGLAAAILDDVAGISHQRRPVMDPSVVMAEDPNFRASLGELSVRLAAARTLQWTESAEAWEAVAAGQPRTRADRVRHRAVVTYVHRECLKVAEEAFRLAGTSVLYKGSAMQRRWRDLQCAGQHYVASSESYRFLGALLCGADPALFPGL